MKARDIRKIAVVLVGAMMISSALFAAPGGRSGRCTSQPGMDGAIWGGGNPPLRISSTPNSTQNDPCAGTTVSTNQTQTEHGHGLANAFGKFMNRLGSVIDGAIWGGGGYYPPPR